MPTSWRSTRPAYDGCSTKRDSCRSGTANGRRRARASRSRWQAHQHWRIDVSYLNIGGTFYYLCSILDGYIRFIAQSNGKIERRYKSLKGECIRPGTPLSLDHAPRLVSWPDGQQEIHTERDRKLEAAGKCGRIAANNLHEVQRRQPTGVCS
jgi:transposase InsO family protein